MMQCKLTFIIGQSRLWAGAVAFVDLSLEWGGSINDHTSENGRHSNGLAWSQSGTDVCHDLTNYVAPMSASKQFQLLGDGRLRDFQFFCSSRHAASFSDGDNNFRCSK